MMHINHQAHSVLGNEITKAYLGMCFNQVTRRVENVDYDGSFRSSGKWDEMATYLNGIQRGYCCYCMRKIAYHSKSLTLEHIIPKSFDSEDKFAEYRHLGYPQLTQDQLIPTSEYMHNISQFTPPYPHTVAYWNLAVSCNGSFLPESRGGKCCNNYRGNEFVNPIYLRSDISRIVGYDENGRLKCLDDNHLPMVDAFARGAHLNYKDLVEIRHIWMALRDCDIKMLEQTMTEGKRKTLLVLSLRQYHNQDANAMKTLDALATKYSKPIEWQNLMDYSWYHGYYRSTMPN